MRPYVIRQGDYLARLAHRLNFEPGEVWSHAKNEGLRAIRSDPQQLAPGDVLFVPEPQPKRTTLQPGSDNGYVARPPTIEVHFTLRQDHKVVPDEPFEVRGLAEAVKGRTDPEGKISFPVPVTTSQVELYFPEMRLAVPLLVGGLDPINTDSGVRQRLARLGMASWNTNRIKSRDAMPEKELATHAIARFQKAYGLAVTGIVDDETAEALDAASRARKAPVKEPSGTR